VISDSVALSSCQDDSLAHPIAARGGALRLRHQHIALRGGVGTVVSSVVVTQAEIVPYLVSKGAGNPICRTVDLSPYKTDPPRGVFVAWPVYGRDANSIIRIGYVIDHKDI
jgi:hypothetical protein